MAKKITGRIGSKKFNLNIKSNNPRIGSTPGWTPKYSPEQIANLKGAAKRAAKRYNRWDREAVQSQSLANQRATNLKYATINNAITQVGANQLADTAAGRSLIQANMATQNAGNKPNGPTSSTDLGSSNTDSTNSMDWIK